MKNKIKLIVVLSLLTIVATLFSGCFLKDFNRVKSISLVGTPKTSYVVGDEFDATDLRIKVEYKNEKQDTVITDLTSDKFEIEFDTSKEGTYKCIIKLIANKNISLSFDYSVTAPDSVFAEGDGSMASPYVVYTEDQLKHIGDKDGYYYQLGGNVEITSTYGNTNAKSFVFDGQGYTITVGGNCQYVFKNPVNSTIKNVVLNIKPGFAHETVLCTYGTGDMVFENIITNGQMEAELNTAMLMCVGNDLKSVTVKNCINNVNITGTAPYCAAFIGLLSPNMEKVVFENCVNYGNIEGVTSWVFVANGAHNAKDLQLVNCRNNGKLVGGAVGLFNMTSFNAVAEPLVSVEAYANSDNAKKLAEKITKCEFKYNANDFVVVPNVASATVNGKYKDVTLVKTADNRVVFSDAAKAKLGEDYTVKAYVRSWIDYKAPDHEGTTYVFSDAIKSLEGSMLYSKLTVDGGKSSATADGAIMELDGKLVLTGNIKEGTVTLKKDDAKYQYYCYFVYDATGALKFCGQINYADIQNA